MQGVPFLAFMSSVIIHAVEDVASFSFIMFVIIAISSAAFAIGASTNPELSFDLLTTYALLLGDFDQVCPLAFRAFGHEALKFFTHRYPPPPLQTHPRHCKRPSLPTLRALLTKCPPRRHRKCTSPRCFSLACSLCTPSLW